VNKVSKRLFLFPFSWVFFPFGYFPRTNFFISRRKKVYEYLSSCIDETRVDRIWKLWWKWTNLCYFGYCWEFLRNKFLENFLRLGFLIDNLNFIFYAEKCVHLMKIMIINEPFQNFDEFFLSSRNWRLMNFF
jgi:hypothetical protein